MPTQAVKPIILLDEEFDIMGSFAGLMPDSPAAGPVLVKSDRDWEDQIDEGEEISL